MHDAIDRPIAVEVGTQHPEYVRLRFSTMNDHRFAESATQLQVTTQPTPGTVPAGSPFTVAFTAVDASNNVMRGTRMVYNTQTGEGHVEGGGKGPGSKNRPRGVFYPKDSGADGASDKPASDKPKKAAK